MAVRWGGLRPDPYDPNARDADGDGIVQEGTAWERPYGSQIISEIGDAIMSGRTATQRPRGLRIIGGDGQPIDYTPTYMRPGARLPGAPEVPTEGPGVEKWRDRHMGVPSLKERGLLSLSQIVHGPDSDSPEVQQVQATFQEAADQLARAPEITSEELSQITEAVQNTQRLSAEVPGTPEAILKRNVEVLSRIESDGGSWGNQTKALEDAAGAREEIAGLHAALNGRGESKHLDMIRAGLDYRVNEGLISEDEKTQILDSLRDMSEEELEAHIVGNLRSIHDSLATQPVRVAVPPGVVEDLAKSPSGRYLTTHETESKHSSGSVRIDAEERFGISPTSDADVRPASSFIVRPDVEEAQRAAFVARTGREPQNGEHLRERGGYARGLHNSYGTQGIVMKPAVKGRTAYTAGDSAKSFGVAAPLEGATDEQLLSAYLRAEHPQASWVGAVTGDMPGNSELETVIAGSFDLHDVEKIELTEHFFTGEAKKLEKGKKRPAQIEAEVLTIVQELLPTDEELRSLGATDETIAKMRETTERLPLNSSIEVTALEKEMMRALGEGTWRRQRFQRLKKDLEPYGVEIVPAMDTKDGITARYWRNANLSESEWDALTTKIRNDILADAINNVQGASPPKSLQIEEKNAEVLSAIEEAGGTWGNPDFAKLHAMEIKNNISDIQKAINGQSTTERAELIAKSLLTRLDKRVEGELLTEDEKQEFLTFLRTASPEELELRVVANLRAMHESMAEQPILVNASAATLMQMADSDDKQYLTTHQTSGGKSQPVTRRRAEIRFGILDRSAEGGNGADPDAAIRPASGYIVTPEVEDQLRTLFRKKFGRDPEPGENIARFDGFYPTTMQRNYGSTVFVMKPEVKGRSGYTLGDSLFGDGVAIPFGDATDEQLLSGYLGSPDAGDAYLGALLGEMDPSVEREALIAGSFDFRDISEIQLGESFFQGDQGTTKGAGKQRDFLFSAAQDVIGSVTEDELRSLGASEETILKLTNPEGATEYTPNGPINKTIIAATFDSDRIPKKAVDLLSEITARGRFEQLLDATNGTGITLTSAEGSADPMWKIVNMPEQEFRSHVKTKRASILQELINSQSSSVRPDFDGDVL